MCNASIATGTTGKDAVSLGGTTVHSAFRLTFSKQEKKRLLSVEMIHTYDVALRNVEAIIIDEICMCDCEIFGDVDERLHLMKGTGDTFGGLDLFACGELKQLPPGYGSPVFSIKNV